MNWKQINEKYPKAFLEWVKNEDSEVESIVFLTNNDEEYRFNKVLKNGFIESYCYLNKEEIYSLPYYFDTLGIRVLPSGAVYKKTFNTVIVVENQKADMLRDENGTMIEFPDRLTATIAGAEKAFEIREAQLNEAQQ